MNYFKQNKIVGLSCVIALSFLIILIFFGKIVFSLNTVFFSLSGDGIQSYFNTTYSILYDQSVLHTKSMNYPYGEVYLYIQPQLWVVGPVKFISHHFMDISGYTIGIINALMLFSIILGAVFLYLFFQKIGMPGWLSIIAGTGIAFLSPQLGRMHGHFTLSYVWAIPLLLYLLALFHTHRNKTFYSIIIAVSLFLLITLHLYYAVFYFTVLFIYLLVIIISDTRHSVKIILGKVGQFALQFILPVLIYFIVFGYFNDPATERPSKPFGFLFYIARPEGVFLPLEMKYGAFLRDWLNFSYVQWEGLSYIGLSSVIGFIIIIAGLFRKSRISRSFLFVTDHLYLNILFWSSLILLLYSFGLPFNLGMRFLVDYIGPLKQLRSLGRFSWLFFYVINIIIFYRLWQWQREKPYRIIVLLLALVMLFADVTLYSMDRQNALNNPYPEWSDSGKNFPVRSKINPSDYQAIIPLPFYHMGSEHFNGGTVRCNLLSKSCLVSIKTGLPIMAIYSGRASINESAKNIAITTEPYRPLEILKDLPNKKPFLVVTSKCPNFSENESELMRICSLIDSTSEIMLYRLKIDSIKKLPNKMADKARKLTDSMKYTGKYWNTDSLQKITYTNFHEYSKIKGYAGNGMKIKGQSVFPLYNGTLYNSNTCQYTVSFWMYPVNKDLITKTLLQVKLLSNQNTVYGNYKVRCNEILKIFDGSWGLIEYSFLLESPADQMQIFIYNDLIPKRECYKIDEFMLRPTLCNVYVKNESFIMWNNRWYPN